MKNKFIKTSFTLIAFLLMFSCGDNEEFTNDSTVSAKSPSLSIDLGFANTQTLVEQEISYDFTVSINEKQIVDVIVFLEQTSGTATNGLDFSMPSSVTISKGTLSASGEISIHEDELAEEEETATIQIGLGTESNLSALASETVTFNIANLTDGDLVVNMSWAPSGTVTDNYGEAIDPYLLADLRLLLTDSPYTQVFESADGAEAETYVFAGNAPDGEYLFVADFYGAMADIYSELDITLTFNQIGAINDQIHTFNAGLSTEFVCSNSYLTMAKVTKTGTNYAFEEVGITNGAPGIAGVYNVVSNGLSTDSGPVNNPLVDFKSIVTVVDNGDGTFTFSDGWAGVYVDWYTMYGYTFLEERILTLTPCLDLSASWTDAFGSGNVLSGVVNSDGTLSIRVSNGFGDYVNAVYTLQ